MKTLILAATLGLSSVATVAFASNDFDEVLKKLTENRLLEISSRPAIVAAIREQNSVTHSYDQARIDQLDGEWRGNGADGELAKSVLGKSISAILADIQSGSDGVFTEVFLTDSVGLNVGQSEMTSDYWQGDEEKWQVPFLKGEVLISEIEFDESTQSYQSQVSLPVTDPETGKRIGGLTVGVNVDLLSK